MAATNYFGVTTATLAAQYLPTLRGTDDTVLQSALDWSAAYVCALLQNVFAIDADPAVFTQTLYPNDYIILARLVSLGAVQEYYQRANAQNVTIDKAKENFNREFNFLQRNPSQLAAYAQLAVGVAGVMSHVNDTPQSQVTMADARFPNPINPRSWTT